MTIDITLVLDAYEANVNTALDELDDDLDRGGVEAAQEGVDAAKNFHPYEDHTPDDGLTDSAHVEKNHATGGGIMTWPVTYADFVDRGTSRANPYPFTPLAEQVAERGLEYKTQEAVARFKAKLEQR